jgi:hypothetical protein
MLAEPYSITEAFLSENSQNRPGPCTSGGCWQGVRGIVVHRTADPYHDAWWIRDYFNTAPDGRFASSQFVLDDQVILQLMPVGEIAYHTGAQGKNYSYLGIETCEHNWGTEAWAETYRKLVWLTGYLVRQHGLRIADVTGHFWWDPTNRPYDPTHLGWAPAEGKATGLFDWNQFIADVTIEIATRVEIVTKNPSPAPCTQGLLLNNVTFVPIRPYTACLLDSLITWDPQGPTITVEPRPVRVQIQSAAGLTECDTGVLIGSRTFVPVRAYTACVAPGATITWDPNGPTVTVTLPNP